MFHSVLDQTHLFLSSTEAFGVDDIDFFNPGGENCFVMNLVFITLKFGVGIHIGIEMIMNMLFWYARGGSEEE